MQTAGRLRFSLWGPEIRNLTFFQRVSGLIYAVTCVFNIFITMSLFAMPVVLIWGARVVAYSGNQELRWLIRLCWLSFAVNRVSEIALFLPSGYRTGQRGARAILWMAPYHSICMIRTFVLPSWLGGQSTSFKPTGSLGSELKERDVRKRAPLVRRLKVILLGWMAAFHLLYILFVLTSVVSSTVHCALVPTLSARLVCLLTHAFWPPVAWVVFVAAAWSPIIYAINPPDVPDSEELLQRDPITHVQYPKEESKEIKNNISNGFFELQYTLITMYVTALFVGTWFF